MSWICPHCGSSHGTTSCPVLVRTYTAAPEDPELDRLLGEPPVYYCTTWEAPARPTTAPTPESKLAAVDQLLRAWADEPATDLVSLLELVERIRRVVTS